MQELLHRTLQDHENSLKLYSTTVTTKQTIDLKNYAAELVKEGKREEAKILLSLLTVPPSQTKGGVL